MTEKTADLRATLKAGTDYAAPWVTVDAATPEELEAKLTALANGSALSALVETANALKGAYNAAPLAPQGQEAQAAPPQPAGWGQSAEPVPSWAAQNAQPQPQFGGGPQNGTPHPEGIKCPLDGNVVQFKQITAKATGKQFKMWTCPNQRSKGDGHYSEFVN